jgi:hypothetical protein
MEIVSILIILSILTIIDITVASFSGDNNWFVHLIQKILQLVHDPVEYKLLFGFEPPSFVDDNGRNIYVTSDRRLFYNYEHAKWHEMYILIEIYRKHGLIPSDILYKYTGQWK